MAGRRGWGEDSIYFDHLGEVLLAGHRRRAARPYAYVVLSLLVGVRTEEARALRWDDVDLEGGDPDADPPVPPMSMWRSVRAHGDTKTKKFRRCQRPARRSSAYFCDILRMVQRGTLRLTAAVDSPARNR